MLSVSYNYNMLMRDVFGVIKAFLINVNTKVLQSYKQE